MGQPVMQWQILAKDPDKLSQFYSKLFAWDIITNNALNYRMIDTRSERGSMAASGRHRRKGTAWSASTLRWPTSLRL